jgi:hypothetical protein
VSLPGGVGVVRGVDGSTVVTDDVFQGRGTFVRGEDPTTRSRAGLTKIARSLVVCYRLER